MKFIKSHWNEVEQIKPPINKIVLCFNGLIFMGKWNGQDWEPCHFERDPKTPPPTHWRALSL